MIIIGLFIYHKRVKIISLQLSNQVITVQERVAMTPKRFAASTSKAEDDTSKTSEQLLEVVK